MTAVIISIISVVRRVLIANTAPAAAGGGEIDYSLHGSIYPVITALAGLLERAAGLQRLRLASVCLLQVNGWRT